MCVCISVVVMVVVNCNCPVMDYLLQLIACNHGLNARTVINNHYLLSQESYVV